MGDFSILVNDPVKKSSSVGKSAFIEGLPNSFDILKGSNTETDINTIIRILESRLYLKPIADEYNLSYQALKRRINISPILGINRKNTGLIEVKLRINDRNNDIKLLNKLKDVFMNYSLVERQRKLKENLTFLNGQYPLLEKESEILYEKLSALRIENNFIDPILEGNSLKERLSILEDAIQSLKEDRKILLILKEELSKSKLSLEAFQNYINSINVDSNLITGVAKINNNKNVIFNQINLIEKELAKAKSFYLPTSLKLEV